MERQDDAYGTDTSWADDIERWISPNSDALALCKPLVT